jgi:enoyl-CoA hydratase/carnithine racemase
MPMTVRSTRQGHVLIVAIDRPEKRNAIDEAHAVALSEAMDELENADELFVAVLTGTSDCFCAGADLGARLAGEQVMTANGFAGITHRPREKPLIAAVEGPAFGGGMEMALACDIIVASRSARFALPEAQRSVLPAAGGAYRLPRGLPPGVAMDMLLTGTPLDAERAYALGLVSRLTESTGALAGAMAAAAEVAACAPLAVRAARRIAVQSRLMSDDEAMELTGKEYAVIKRTSDFREGPRAFVEKRSPRWTGH